MTSEERNGTRAHAILEHLNALDDLADRKARYNETLCPILKAAEVDRNGSLSIQSHDDPKLVDTTAVATFRILRILDHAAVVAVL